jgi:hypothetical protein
MDNLFLYLIKIFKSLFKGYNALHYAAANGNTNAIMHLLSYSPIAILNPGLFNFTEHFSIHTGLC